MFKTFVKTRTIFDLEGMPETDFTDRVLICMPKFAWELSRTLIRSYGLRNTTFAASYATGGYVVPDEVTFDKIQASVSAFLEEDDMCTDLTAAIEQLTLSVDSIASAILDTANCGNECEGGGSYGTGCTGVVPAIFVDDGETTFPPGFVDRPEYLVYKCQVANAIVASIEQDFAYILIGDLVTLAIEALILTLLTPIPGDEIIAFAAFLIAMFVQGLLTDIVLEAQTFVEANEEEIVCLLYKSATSQDAYDDLLDLWDTSGVSTGAKLLLAYLTTIDATNALFERNTLWENNTATVGVDCAVCDVVPGTHIIRVWEGPTPTFVRDILYTPGDLVDLLPMPESGPVGGCSGDVTKGLYQFIPPIIIDSATSDLFASCIKGVRLMHDNDIPPVGPWDIQNNQWADVGMPVSPLGLFSAHSEDAPTEMKLQTQA